MDPRPLSRRWVRVYKFALQPIQNTKYSLREPRNLIGHTRLGLGSHQEHRSHFEMQIWDISKLYDQRSHGSPDTRICYHQLYWNSSDKPLLCSSEIIKSFIYWFCPCLYFLKGAMHIISNEKPHDIRRFVDQCLTSWYTIVV
jgi:hypothetical protein